MDLSQHLNHMAWIEGEKLSCLAALFLLFDFLCAVQCVVLLFGAWARMLCSARLVLFDMSNIRREMKARTEKTQNSSPFLPQPHPILTHFSFFSHPPFWASVARGSYRSRKASPRATRDLVLLLFAKMDGRKETEHLGKGGDPFISFYHWFEGRKDSPFGFEEMTLECICFFGLVEVMWLRLFFLFQ